MNCHVVSTDVEILNFLLYLSFAFLFIVASSCQFLKKKGIALFVINVKSLFRCNNLFIFKYI